MRFFSDNAAPAHPKVIEAIAAFALPVRLGAGLRLSSLQIFTQCRREPFLADAGASLVLLPH